MTQDNVLSKITQTNRLAQIAAYATECGFLRLRERRYMEEAATNKDYWRAARAETRMECYAEIEQSLTKILLQ